MSSRLPAVHSWLLCLHSADPLLRCTMLHAQAYLWDLHNMTFFTCVMVLGGIFQSTGWPSVVAIMANWFGKGKRGLVMGVWNAHTSLGNILGTVVAAACLQYGWGWAFIVPGLLIAALGVFVFAALVPQPSDVGLSAAGGNSISGGGPAYEPVKTTDVVGDRAMRACMRTRALDAACTLVHPPTPPCNGIKPAHPTAHSPLPFALRLCPPHHHTAAA